ncbi:histidine kinase [Leptospira hartskeerlii]|uniref:histidine kinase n=1 Tax=Leptospira hartskeerlii TaxID=2023177 RepID=A0A2M9XFX3_9LEPT|nr:MASE3 domain-containing protein [Leptospira hartskeerlii]PJZ26534.1 histidine kinase [Leptospira hartskeerlii]PJZ35061.1 histidine kinase [Leptospira hartskeerlii]
MDQETNRHWMNVIVAFFLASLPILIIQILHPYIYFESEIPPYLVFHNIAESFSIIVSMSIFGVGWFTYAQSKDKHTLFLGTACLGIALMDMMHMLGYTGMPDLFTPNSPNKSTQFWIIVRFFAAISFLTSAFIPNENGSFKQRSWLLLGSISVSAFAFVSVTYYPDLLPVTFSTEIGLTNFKKVSEFVIIFVLILALIAYWFRIPRFGWDHTKYYLYAFVFGISSELVFAVYTTVFDIYNVLGHIYKIISFFLIYRGVFISSINSPYRNVLETNEKLSKSLSEKENLIKEVYHRSNNTLQVIGSLIFLQAEAYPDSPEIKTIVNRIQDRIQAISLVHRLLFSGQDLSSVPIKQYISELSNYALQTNGNSSCKLNLNLEIEDRKLLFDAVIPIGLILSELLNNSIKYAFPEASSGNISITFYEGQDQRFHLTYSDDGVGIEENYNFKNSSSLGIQLVQGIAESQLSGKVHFKTGPKFQCEIDFPINLYKKRV